MKLIRGRTAIIAASLFVVPGGATARDPKTRSLGNRRAPVPRSARRLFDAEQQLPRLHLAGAFDLARRLHAPAAGVKVREIAPKWSGKAAHAFPLVRIDIASRKPNARRILITSGVHGHEALGPTAALEVAEDLSNSSLREHFSFTIFPMMNPAGLARRTSETAAGSNLSFIGKDLQPEASAFVGSLKGASYYAALDLHGAQLKSGLFIIRMPDDKSRIAEGALNRIPGPWRFQSPDRSYPYYLRSSRRVAALKRRPNPKAPYDYTFYGPGIAVSRDHPTVKKLMADRGTPHAFTLEYPGTIKPLLRHQYMVTLVHALLAELAR